MELFALPANESHLLPLEESPLKLGGRSLRVGRNHDNLCPFAARACHAKDATHLGDALLHSGKTEAVMIPVNLETNSVVLKLQTDLRGIETEPGLEACSMGVFERVR